MRWDSAAEGALPEVLARQVSDFAVASPKVFFLQNIAQDPAAPESTPLEADALTAKARLASIDLRVETQDPGEIATLERPGKKLVLASDRQIGVIDDIASGPGRTDSWHR